MKNAKRYEPPFSITPAILQSIADIGEAVGRVTDGGDISLDLRLRRVNRIRTIRGSLAIEGNALSEEQITAILEGRRVVAPLREIREACARFDARASGLALSDGVSSVDRQFGISEFEFIHPFTDGNGRMGRLWQTLILHRWNPLFSRIPVESVVHAHQEEYYRALRDSTDATDSAPFIAFMLSMILEALRECESLQVEPQVGPQVERLLKAISGEMSAQELQNILGLGDRKSFRKRYLVPALQAHLIEMTVPDKPNSRLQKYRLTGHGRRLADRSEGVKR